MARRCRITHTHGAPSNIKTDNAKSEQGHVWNTHCRDNCIGQTSTEPDSPWQNPAERRIGSLASMVKNVMAAFDVPLNKHDWAQKWCCDVHNIAANRKLGWINPLAISEGHTSDASVFRFHIWEPIWYYNPQKQPRSNFSKGRWLGIAHLAGDAFTYYIQTEKDMGEGRNQVLIRSLIKSRRKNIGTPAEYVNDDPELADFFFGDNDSGKHSSRIPEVDPHADQGEMESRGDQDASQIKRPIEVETVEDTEDDVNVTIMGEPISSEPIDMELPTDPEELKQLYDQFEMEEEPDCEFERIVDHVLRDGKLLLKVQYDNDATTHIVEVPFAVLKKDVPLELAKYIRDKVLEDRRNGHYNEWAKKMLRSHARCVRRLYRSYNVGATIRAQRARRANKNRVSKNMRNDQRGSKVKFGIKVPHNTREALLMDKQNGNSK